MTFKMDQDACLVCFQNIQIGENKDVHDYGDGNFKKTLFQCCKSLLLGVEISSSFNWSSAIIPNDKCSPFCSTCFQFSKELREMEERLNKIKRDFDKYIEAFSSEVLQTRLIVLSRKISSVEKAITENSHEDDLISSNDQSEDTCDTQYIHNEDDLTSPSGLSPANSLDIKIENTGVEEGEYFDVFSEDYFENENDYASDYADHKTILPISPQYVLEEKNELNLKIGKAITLCNKPSDKSHSLKTVKVLLERLQFDSKGKIIHPPAPAKEICCKRKAAIAATESLAKNLIQEQFLHLFKKELKPTNATKRDKDNDPDFVHEDLELDSEGEASDENLETTQQPPKRKKTKTTDKLKCSSCSSKFNLASELDAHSKKSRHINEKSFQCQKCFQAFYRNKDLEWHTRACSFEGKTCNICLQHFESFKTYRLHLRQHLLIKYNTTEQIKCKECNKRFNSRRYLQEHMNSHTGKKPYKCSYDQCEATFAYTAELHLHKSHHLIKTRIQCRICYLFYKDQNRLNRHMEKGHVGHGRRKRKNAKKEPCHNGGRNYGEIDFIYSAEYFDSVKKEYLSTEDETLLPPRDDLDSEIDRLEEKGRLQKRIRKRKIEPRPKIELKCVICEKVFNSCHKLEIHSEETGHENEKTVECDNCHEKFYRGKDMEWHARECNFVSKTCRICGEIFTSFKPYRYHLREHRRPASKPKRFVSHKCTKCQKNFFTRHNLKEHMKTHFKPSKAFARAAISAAAKNRRKKIMNGEEDDMGNLEYSDGGLETSLEVPKEGNFNEEIRCVTCSTKFKTSLELDIHSEETGHINEKFYECKKCQKKFYIFKSMYFHDKFYCSFVSKDCDICGKTFTTYNKYRSHFKKHSISITNKGKRKPREETERERQMNGNFKCEECQKYFSTRLNLTEHMSMHRGVKRFKCSIKDCKAKFYYHSELGHHKADHLIITKIQCEICNLFYKDEGRLNTHMKKEHTEVNNIQCDSCEKSFKEMKHFVAHKIAIHDMESPYKCKLCEMIFSYKLDLTIHMDAVHGQKTSVANNPLVCTVCDQIFKNNTTLYHHILSHTTIPKEILSSKYELESGSCQCEECGKVFPNGLSLKAHVKGVHSDRQYPCKVCGKVFKTKCVQKIHEKIHTDEQYVCEVCGRGFTKKCNLTTHFKRIHEQNKTPRKPFTKTPFAKPK